MNGWKNGKKSVNLTFSPYQLITKFSAKSNQLIKTDKISEPVFLTAFNSPFFRNGMRLVSSIRSQGFQNKIVIYDLGIDPEKLVKVEKV